MENSQYLCVPIWVHSGVCFGRMNHDGTMICVWIDDIGITSYIVSCVVYAQGLDCINFTVYYTDSVAIFDSKILFVTVKLAIKEAVQQVVLQFGKKVLWCV